MPGPALPSHAAAAAISSPAASCSLWRTLHIFVSSYSDLSLPLAPLQAYVNIDISMIIEPLNNAMRMLSGEIGRASCNFNDKSAEQMFLWHYLLLPLTVLSIVLACGMAVCLHKVHAPFKGFGESFTTKTAAAQGFAMFNFFM